MIVMRVMDKIVSRINSILTEVFEDKHIYTKLSILFILSFINVYGSVKIGLIFVSMIIKIYFLCYLLKIIKLNFGEEKCSLPDVNFKNFEFFKNAIYFGVAGFLTVILVSILFFTLFFVLLTILAVLMTLINHGTASGMIHYFKKPVEFIFPLLTFSIITPIIAIFYSIRFKIQDCFNYKNIWETIRPVKKEVFDNIIFATSIYLFIYFVSLVLTKLGILYFYLASSFYNISSLLVILLFIDTFKKVNFDKIWNENKGDLITNGQN